MKLIRTYGLLGKQGGPPAFIWVPALLIASVILVAPIYLAIRASESGAAGFELLFRIRVLDILLRTIYLVCSVTVVSILLAVPLAWIQVRTDLRGAKFWRIVTALPLVIPTYVGGFVLVVALGPKGMLQGLLEILFGIQRVPDISGFPGAFFILTMLCFPYVLLPVRSALFRMDSRLEESSKNLGYGNISTFLRITLPLLRPSIMTGALLVALYTLSDFGAVSLLRYETFTWAIFSQYEGSLNRSFGALLSLVLMFIALTIVISEGFLRGNARYYRSDQGSSLPPTLIHLRGWQYVAQFYCGLVTVLGLVLPCYVLTYWLIRGLVAGERMLLMWGLAWNSLAVSAAAATVTMAAAVPIAVLSVRFPGYISLVIEKVTYIGFALPGIAVALGLVFFGSHYVPWLYQTFWILIIVYVILFLPAAVGATRSSLLQVQPDLEHAGRSLGKGTFTVLRSITLPLLRPGMLAGAAIVFLLTMKELPATLILSPIGFRTLATAVWSASSEAFFARAAAPALLLILVSALPLAILSLREDSGNRFRGR